MTRQEIENQAGRWLQHLQENDFAGGSHNAVARDLSEHAYGLPIAAHLMVLLEGPFNLNMLSRALADEAVRRAEAAKPMRVVPGSYSHKSDCPCQLCTG